MVKQNKKDLSPLRQDHLAAAGGNPLLIEPEALRNDKAFHAALSARIKKIRTEKLDGRDVCSLLEQLGKTDHAYVPGAINRIGTLIRGRYAKPAIKALSDLYKKAESGEFKNVDKDLTLMMHKARTLNGAGAGRPRSAAKTPEAS